MAQLTRQIVMILALAIFAGTSSSLAQGSAAGRPQPAPEALETRILIPPPPANVAGQGTSKPEDVKTLEQKIEALEKELQATKERTKRLKEEAIEAAVDNDVEEEIRRRAREIELEKAEKEARKKLEKYDTPAMRKARKEIKDREENLREGIEAQIEARKNTGLYCPNEDDVNEVFIHPSIRHSYQSVVHSRMTIENKTDATLHIRRTAGRSVTNLVENMCKGGTITIFEKEAYGSSTSTRVSYRAIAVGGQELANPNSPQIYMYHCYGVGCQVEFPATWEIRERKTR